MGEGGDTEVIVQSQQVRPPYSPYGQTEWSNDQAAIFAFGLPCIGGAEPVVHQMRNLGGSQRWGLASFADLAAKGDWGPEPDGGYLVRQFALVTNGSGSFGISLAGDDALCDREPHAGHTRTICSSMSVRCAKSPPPP